MQSESILGLLLRALRQAAEQEHGERYHLGNLPAANFYSDTVGHTMEAISALFLAERSIGQQEGIKRSQTP